MTSGPVRSILALVPNWVGDVAMATPALRALHRRFPEARLTVAGKASACALLEGLPWIHGRFILPPRPGLKRLVQAARVLAPHARDLVVVFPHSFRSGLLAWLTRSSRRLGYARSGRTGLLTHPVTPYRPSGRIEPIYMAQEYLDLVKALGCEDDGRGLELDADPTLVQRVRDRLRGTGPLVGLAPGAAFGPSKLWPPERYARVADLLAERAGARFVLLTGPGEEAVRQAVLDAAQVPLLEPHSGRPGLDTLKAAVSQLDLLICNDSGTRHVGVAFQVPVICLMGPTSPAYSEGPYERGRVLRIEVDCGPCQKPVCATDHRCMTGISPEWVVDTALEWL